MALKKNADLRLHFSDPDLTPIFMQSTVDGHTPETLQGLVTDLFIFVCEHVYSHMSLLDVLHDICLIQKSSGKTCIESDRICHGCVSIKKYISL